MERKSKMWGRLTTSRLAMAMTLTSTTGDAGSMEALEREEEEGEREIRGYGKGEERVVTGEALDNGGVRDN